MSRRGEARRINRGVCRRLLAAAFYLLAELFDDDPFAILAWRGRDRASLLENLAAARSAAPSPQGRSHAGRSLDDSIDHFFEPSGPLPAIGQSPVPAVAVLDQVPADAVSVRGHALVDLLRPAYAALGDRSTGEVRL